jgi:DNA-binding protein HU-beta
LLDTKTGVGPESCESGETVDVRCAPEVEWWMNKKELAAELAQKAELTQAKAIEIINMIFSVTPGEGIIAVELDAGRKVTIPGFGTFATRHVAARTGTNPSTGHRMEIPAKTRPTFKPGKNLRELVAA